MGALDEGRDPRDGERFAGARAAAAFGPLCARPPISACPPPSIRRPSQRKPLAADETARQTHTPNKKPPLGSYCEQTDVHSPGATVEEALWFSARLRLPGSVTNKQARPRGLADPAFGGGPRRPAPLNEQNRKSSPQPQTTLQTPLKPKL
jgi:hypothetical protein